MIPIFRGDEAIRIIHGEFPSINLIAFTQYDDNDSILALIESGAPDL